MTRSPLALAILLAASTATAQSPFGVTDVRVPGDPDSFTGRAVAAGDVDNDGDQDAIGFFDNNPNLITVAWVFINDGDGTLTAAHSYDIPLGARDSALALMNNDAFQDIVVCSAFGQSLTVALGNGDGTFQTPVSYPTGGTASVIDLADIDSDGDLDVAVAVTDTKETLVYLNDGNAALTLNTSRTVAPYLNEACLFVDVDLDGLPDLGLSAGTGGGPMGSDGAVIFYENLGGVGPAWLGFEATHSAAATTGNTPAAVDAGDLDGQPGDDIVFANSFSDSITILTNNGAGGFDFAGEFNFLTLPTSIKLADYDLDSDLDILAAVNAGTTNTSFLVSIENLGGGAFATPVSNSVGLFAQRLAVADFTGDTFPDVAYANLDNTLPVATGLGPDGIASIRRIPVTERLNGPAIADLNHDDINDLVFASQFNNAVNVLLGTPGGDFPTQTVFPAGNAATFLHAADLNNDTHIDLVVKGTRLEAFFNDGTGAFAPPVDLGILTGGFTATKHELADIDNDLDLDILVSTIQQTSPFLGQLHVLRNNGLGSFTPDAPILLDDNLVGTVVTGDFNDDGWPDAAVSSNFRGIAIVLNDAAGNLTTISNVDNPGTNNRNVLEAADLDDDGDADLIVPIPGDEVTAILISNGDGTFQPPVLHDTGGRSGYPSITDLNDDTIPDILFASSIPSQARYKLGALINDGAANFSLILADNAGGPAEAVAGDIDNDGDTDAICAGTSEFFIAANINITNDLPAPPTTCVGDLDGDNDTDVFDFNVFAPAFGSTGLPPFTGGDLDGDGDVDVFDFNIFAPDFGCTP